MSKVRSCSIHFMTYTSIVWHFCSEGNTQKMERIQERALRFIYNDQQASYESLLQKSGLTSLHIRRMKGMALEAFKIFHKHGPAYLHDLLDPKHSKFSFRYENTVNIPRVRTTTYGLRSFRYSAAKLWNELPNSFRSVSSFSQFKRLVNDWNGTKCHCGACR